MVSSDDDQATVKTSARFLKNLLTSVSPAKFERSSSPWLGVEPVVVVVLLVAEGFAVVTVGNDETVGFTRNIFIACSPRVKVSGTVFKVMVT